MLGYIHSRLGERTEIAGQTPSRHVIKSFPKILLFIILLPESNPLILGLAWSRMACRDLDHLHGLLK